MTSRESGAWRYQTPKTSWLPSAPRPPGEKAEAGPSWAGKVRDSGELQGGNGDRQEPPEHFNEVEFIVNSEVDSDESD